MRAKSAKGVKKAVVFTGVIIAFGVLTGGLCDEEGCEPELAQPTLQIWHHGEANPWITFWDWKNLHTSLLCDQDPKLPCSLVDPTVCTGAAIDDQFMLSVYDIEEAGTEAWKRDRFMFLAHGYGSSYETPTLFGAEDSGVFRTGGPYRFWEGEGITARMALFDISGNVAYVRRYRRGLCSAGVRLDPHVDPATGEMVPGIEEQGHAMIAKGLKCGVSGFSLQESFAKVYIGTSDCYDIYSDDLDYIHLYYYYNVAPKGTILGNSYWTFGIHLWFRLGAQRRSNGLDCPKCPKSCYKSNGCLYLPIEAPFVPGCSTEDINECMRPCRAKHCTQDQDCCDLPGVVCREAGNRTNVYGAHCNSRNLCEKESFLDVVEGGLSFSTKMRGKCEKDLSCRISYWVFKQVVGSYRDDPYGRIFAPMIYDMYEKAWVEPCKPDQTGDLPDFCNAVMQCNTDEDCYQFLPQDNFDTRCSANEYNGQHYCEMRPMYFYGLNTYPNQVEVVLARDRNDEEWFLLNQDQGEIDPTTGEYIREPACRIKEQGDPDHGLTPASNLWIYGTWP